MSLFFSIHLGWCAKSSFWSHNGKCKGTTPRELLYFYNLVKYGESTLALVIKQGKQRDWQCKSVKYVAHILKASIWMTQERVDRSCKSHYPNYHDPSLSNGFTRYKCSLCESFESHYLYPLLYVHFDVWHLQCFQFLQHMRWSYTSIIDRGQKSDEFQTVNVFRWEHAVQNAEQELGIHYFNHKFWLLCTVRCNSDFNPLLVLLASLKGAVSFLKDIPMYQPVPNNTKKSTDWKIAYFQHLSHIL